jgi:hypothetical protein
MMSGQKPWSLTGSARAARDARVAAIRYMRTSPVERAWHATVLERGHESRTAGAGNPETARSLFFSTMGYPPPYPGTWRQASTVILNDEARYLLEAELYVLTPQMLAVLAAAAQTLSFGDLSLLREDDLPGPAGLLMLPQPLRLRLPAGSIEEVQAYAWRLPWRLPLPAGLGFASTELPPARPQARPARPRTCASSHSAAPQRPQTALGSQATPNGTTAGWYACTKSTSGTRASTSTASASAAPTSKDPQTSPSWAETS